MDIQNLQTHDPFADEGTSTKGKLIHIRLQQRSGRKTITTVQGIDEIYSTAKILKVCRKEFSCNGTCTDHPEYGEVLQLQGDHRLKMRDFLITYKLATPDQIKVHGF